MKKRKLLWLPLALEIDFGGELSNRRGERRPINEEGGRKEKNLSRIEKRIWFFQKLSIR